MTSANASPVTFSVPRSVTRGCPYLPLLDRQLSHVDRTSTLRGTLGWFVSVFPIAAGCPLGVIGASPCSVRADHALIVLLPHPRAKNYKSSPQGELVAQPLPSGAPNHIAQLAALNLRLEYFHDALRAGEQARRLVTKNDPKNAAGTVDYFQRVRVLRHGLITRANWARADLDGLPLVVNPDLTMAIGVLLGDHKTGWLGAHHPRSKRPVGEKKIKLVAQNQQLALIPRPAAADEVDLETADLSNVHTWFLITHRRVKGDRVTVSSELSEPEGTGDDAYVERYVRRIPFPNLEFKGVIPYAGNSDSDSTGYEVAVDEK